MHIKIQNRFAAINLICSTLLRLPWRCQNWWDILLDYIPFYKGREVIFRLKTGELFHSYLGRYDSLILNEVFIIEHYINREHNVDILQGDIVVDIEAYIGDFTVYAANKVGKRGKVFALEPSPNNFRLLQKNINANRKKNIIAEEVAISGKDGSTTFYPDSRFAFGDSFTQRETSLSPIKIPTFTFESWLKKHTIDHIDYLKVDCEGAELDIIKATSIATLQKIDIIALEYHLEIYPESELVKMRQKIISAGFELFEDHRYKATNCGQYFFVRKGLVSYF